MPVREWYKKWFNSPYYDLLYFERNEKEAAGFIHRAIELLQPPLNAVMLDIACGKGRHSKVLADMGFDVTGIDLSPHAIEEARKYERDNLHFYLHDMRLPFYINYFDYAFNLFTSFGYFNSRRENENTVRTIAGSLKKNGILVLDYLNVHYAEKHLVPGETQKLNNIIFHITRWHDETHFFKQIQVEDAAQPRHLFTERVAKFSFGDFTEMLAYENMQVQEVYGDYNLGKYDVNTSPRLILIAKKISR